MIKPTKHQLEEIAQCIIDLGLSHDEIVDYLMGWFELETQDIATTAKADGEWVNIDGREMYVDKFRASTYTDLKWTPLPEPLKESGWLRDSNTHVNKSKESNNE